MEHSTEILYNKTEVYCSAVHRFGSDALLLARFCEPRRSQKAADLCSGCGIVSLEWHDRGHRGLCACGFRLLKDGGKLSLCHRPERLAEVLAVLRAHRLEPKRLAFVKNKPDAAPCLFLVEAQKNRRTGLRIEPDVLITAGAAMYGEVK